MSVDKKKQIKSLNKSRAEFFFRYAKEGSQRKDDSNE